MIHLNYPRLSSHDASELLLELADSPPEDRADIGRSFRGRATQYETAANLAPSSHLEEVRDAIVALAKESGFPTRSPVPAFDRALPALLNECLSMSPAEGGTTEVWSYLTLVVVPDVALWRWPNEDRNPSYERLIGKPRNVLRRHWWRSVLLGHELCTQLGEDEIVAIEERPASLGGDPRVARAVASTFLKFVSTHSVELSDGTGKRAFSRMHFMRDLAKRVLRIGSVVFLSTLDDADLLSLVNELAEQTGQARARLQGGGVKVDAAPVADVVMPPMRAIVEQTPNSPSEGQDVEDQEAVRRGLEHRYNLAVQRVGQRAEAELSLNTTALTRVLKDFGAIAATRKILSGESPEWFATVAKWGRPDLSVEAVVLSDEFQPIFTDEERATARATLAENAERRGQHHP